MLEIAIEFLKSQTEEERIELMENVMNAQIDKTGKRVKEIVYRKKITDIIYRDLIATEKWQGKGKYRNSYIEQPIELEKIDMVILRMA